MKALTQTGSYHKDKIWGNPQILSASHQWPLIALLTLFIGSSSDIYLTLFIGSPSDIYLILFVGSLSDIHLTLFVGIRPGEAANAFGKVKSLLARVTRCV